LQIKLDVSFFVRVGFRFQYKGIVDLSGKCVHLGEVAHLNENRDDLNENHPYLNENRGDLNENPLHLSKR
jgi:hypothetical protein